MLCERSLMGSLSTLSKIGPSSTAPYEHPADGISVTSAEGAQVPARPLSIRLKSLVFPSADEHRQKIPLWDKGLRRSNEVAPTLQIPRGQNAD